MIAVQPINIFCFYTRSVLLNNLSSKAIKAQYDSSKIAAEAVSNLRTITSFSSQNRILKMLEKTQHTTRKQPICGGQGPSLTAQSRRYQRNYWRPTGDHRA
jgi:ATP-binding cassette subfamily B (MDR/TAP) protein 1